MPLLWYYFYMNFPEYSFVDQRLAKVRNGFHPHGASSGQFADPEAKQLYNEVQAMTQAQGAKPQHAGALLTQICNGRLIRDQWSGHPNFTIDRRVHDGFLKPAGRTGAEALYDALSAKAAEMIGKTVTLEQAMTPVLVDAAQ
jgi:hypothetical protein